MSEDTVSRQNGRFQPGQSGNPAGKPKGARHRTTILAEKLMADDAEAIVKKVVEAAKAGDLAAARLVLDRIAPARRGSPIAFELPGIESTADAVSAMGSILTAVAAGDLTAGEASELIEFIDSFLKSLQAKQSELRFQALQERSRR